VSGLRRHVEGGPRQPLHNCAHPRSRARRPSKTSAPPPRLSRSSDARRESIFAQSVQAEKNKDDVMAKKFAEAVKKAKESPMTGKPLRDFDLD
jgi:hypothetical protein